MKKILALLGAIALLLVTGFTIAHADVTNNYWNQTAPNVLMTNTGNGLANADIHVAHCYIGTGTGVSCGGGGGGGVSAVTGFDSVATSPSTITSTGTVGLVNDTATPGASRFYGTNSSGVRGWFPLTVSLPPLAQNHLYVGNSSNLPVDAGTHITYTGSSFHVDFGGTNAINLDTSSLNTLVGYNAFTGNTASRGVGIGQGAGSGNTGQQLTAVGYQSANANHSDFNTLIGADAGFNGGGTGSDTGLGWSALNGAVGNQEVSVGYQAGFINAGNDAVSVGYHAGAANSFNNVVQLGSNSIADQANQFVVGSSGAPISNWQINGIDYAMPSADGTTGQALTTDGSGTLTWSTVGGGGGAPIYPATLIPFGDGTTPGGITTGPGLSDPIFAYDGTQLLLSHESGGGPSGTFINAGDPGSTGDSSIGIGIYDNESAPEAGAALKNITSGSRDIGIGGVAGETVTNEHDNVFLGHGTDITAGNNNTINLGTGAISTMSNQITFGGPSSFLIPNWVVNGVNWVMPSANSAGVFTNDGSGNLNWSSTVPASYIHGTNTQIQYADAITGALTGDSNFTRDNGAGGNTFIAATSGTLENSLELNASSDIALRYSDSSSSASGALVINPVGAEFDVLLSNSNAAGTSTRNIDLTGNDITFNIGQVGSQIILPQSYSDPTDNGKTLILNSATGQLSWGNPTVTPGSIVGTATEIPYFDASTGAMTSDVNFTRNNNLGFGTYIATGGSNNTFLQLIGDGTTESQFNQMLNTGSQGGFNLLPDGTNVTAQINSDDILGANTYSSSVTASSTGVLSSSVTPGGLTNTVLLNNNVITENSTDGTSFNAQRKLENGDITDIYNDIAGNNSANQTFTNAHVLTQFQDLGGNSVSSSELTPSNVNLLTTDNSTYLATLTLANSGNTFSYTNMAGTTGSIAVNTTQIATDISDGTNFDTKTTQDVSGYQSSFTNILTNTQSGFKASDQMTTTGMLSGGNTSALIIDDSINESWLQGTYNTAPNSILLFANFASGSISLGDSSNSKFQTLATVNDTQNKISLTDGLSSGSGIFFNGMNSGTPNTNNLIQTDAVNFSSLVSQTPTGNTISFTGIGGAFPAGQLDSIVQNGANTTIQHVDASTNHSNILSMDGSQASDSFNNLTSGHSGDWQFSDDGSTGNVQLNLDTSDAGATFNNSIVLNTAGITATYQSVGTGLVSGLTITNGITTLGTQSGGNDENIAINDAGRNILMSGTYNGVPNSIFEDIDTSNGIVNLGDFNGSLNGTTETISDNLQTYTFNKLAGTGTRVVTADSTGVLGTSNGQLGHVIFTPTTGGTVNLTDNSYNAINPTGAILALTVNFPSSPANNDVVEIKYDKGVSTITYSGGTIVGGITTAALGDYTKFTYDSATTTWY